MLVQFVHQRTQQYYDTGVVNNECCGLALVSRICDAFFKTLEDNLTGQSTVLDFNFVQHGTIVFEMNPFPA